MADPFKKDKKGKAAKKKGNALLERLVARFYKLLSLIIFVAIIASSFYFIIKPRYEEIGAGGQYNKETLQAELKRRQDHMQDLTTMVAAMNKVSQADIAKLGQILPNEKEIADLFIQTEALANKNGFLLNNVSFADAGSQGVPTGVRRLNVSLSLFGLGYDNMKELLNSIEENIRLFDVNAVFFTPDSPDYSINIATYYLPDKK